MGVKKEKKPIEVSEIDSMAVRLRALGITCAFVAETVKRQGETKILAENVTTLRDAVEDVRRGIDKLQSAANERSLYIKCRAGVQQFLLDYPSEPAQWSAPRTSGDKSGPKFYDFSGEVVAPNQAGVKVKRRWTGFVVVEDGIATIEKLSLDNKTITPPK